MFDFVNIIKLVYLVRVLLRVVMWNYIWYSKLVLFIKNKEGNFFVIFKINFKLFMILFSWWYVW